MATLAYQNVSASGTTISFVAAGGSGDKVKVNDRGAFLVRNGAGAPVTVTIDTPGVDKYGNAIPQITKSVAAAGTAAFGPFGSDLKGNDNLVAITYSDNTSVTVAAVTL